MCKGALKGNNSLRVLRLYKLSLPWLHGLETLRLKKKMRSPFEDSNLFILLQSYQ